MSIKRLLTKSKHINVLYVEDDDFIRDDTKDMLEDIFLSVVTAGDGEEAFKKYLQYYKETGTYYDIVISDILMPNMTGIELSKEILNIHDEQIIIIISAYNNSEYLVDLINLGIHHFLQKPLDLNNAIKIFLTTSNNIYSHKLIDEYHQKIKDMNSELHELNENLEKKVKERTLQIENQLYFDKLTGLYSHTALIRDMNEKSKEFTLFLINIDSFHTINGLYGFQIGNKILQQFANCLNEFDNEYTVYRTYADEFVLLKPSESFKSNVLERDLQKIKNKIQAFEFNLLKNDEYIELDATIGVSICNTNPLLTADMALRHAKKHRLGYKIYTQDLDLIKEMKNILNWSGKIKTAIQNDKVFPVYQPILNKNQEIVKYEVLMRISETINGEEKLISPYLFLDAAIKTKQYNTLSHIIIQKSFKRMNESDKDFSINLSYEDIYNNTLIDILQKYLQKYEKIGKRLIIEILETELIENHEVMNAFIKDFKKYGVRIAIDDFGTGHSNFSNILEFNPDYIKIDGSFIKNINSDKKSYSLVKGIITSARELNIKTIAEFVHSKEVFEVTLALGIDEFQGYYFSEPCIEPPLSITIEE